MRCVVLFCAFVGGWASGQTQCIEPSFIDPDAFCPAVVDPVCGCDGLTYSNPCHAQFFGGNVTWTPGVCPPTTGCTYPFACNFNPQATEDDGSCLFPPEHCGLPPGTPSGGCTYPEAMNYIESASWDDGSCLFDLSSGVCPEDLNQDGIVNTPDLLLFLGTFGTLCLF